MPAPHFFVERSGGIEAGARLTLSVEDSRHALRSLRLRPADEVSLSDGEGTVGAGRIVAEEDGRAVVAVESTRRVVPRGTLVSVAVAPPKGDRLAWTVQKLGELGVDELVLMRTERTVRDWDGDRSDRAVRRLHAVAREAAMQSRQPFVMRILGPRSLEEAIGAPEVVAVVLDPGAAFALSTQLPPEAAAVRLVVGPEGGFAERELDQAVELGARLGALGEPVLRIETAAVAGAVLVLHRYGRLG